jgi:peptidoglycan/LPS O-acetylase OafA/YrhL
MHVLQDAPSPRYAEKSEAPASRAALYPVTYRPDIDGLRAVAVLSVIGFHAGPASFPGGYVGVDIFFVISGFLITSIICKQIEQGKFSFVDFYARRCKRIFPALIAVLLAVVAYGWLFLLPDEFARLGKHIAAGAGFISNFAFWREAGYFDKAADSKPLLHLWSLGIEEQFYLLWPPLLVWVWRRKSDVFAAAVGIASVSFVLNVMLVSLWKSSDGYYLPPTRFWELLVGGALAYAYLSGGVDAFIKRTAAALPLSSPDSFQNLLSASGLLLIVIAIFALNKGTLFPGWWALLPTIGAALMIMAGPSGRINRLLLSNRIFVFVGLISYPLYLWHWPLLSYAYIMTSGDPSRTVQLFAVGAAFLLAWLTYRIIEKPIRTMPNRAALAITPALGLVALLGLAMFSRQLHARSENFGLDNIIKAEAGEWGFPGPKLTAVHTATGYHFERGGGSHKVLFVGDSHVEQYYPRIDRLMTEHPDTAKGVLFVTSRGCLPIPDIKGITFPKCKGLAENALSVAQSSDVDTVVLASAWNRYNDIFGTKEALEGLTATIVKYEQLGKRVYVVLPIPRGESFDPPSLVKRSILDLGFVVQKQIDRASVDALLEPASSRVTQVAKSTGATIIDPVPFVCHNDYCPTLADDGLPVYTDNSHLRAAFVREHITFLDSMIVPD